MSRLLLLLRRLAGGLGHCCCCARRRHGEGGRVEERVNARRVASLEGQTASRQVAFAACGVGCELEVGRFARRPRGHLAGNVARLAACMRPCLGGFAGLPSPRGGPWWVRQRVGPTRFARWTAADAPLSTAGSTPEAGVGQASTSITSPTRAARRRGHRATAANEQRSSAPRTSSSVLTGSGALVARLQFKSVRHVQATHRRQARRISAARPLIRSDWNQARPPRGLRPASPSFVPRPRTGCTPLHLVRAADGAALASSLMPDPGGVGNGQASPAPATKNRPRHTSSPDLHINDAAPAVAFSGETLRRVRSG